MRTLFIDFVKQFLNAQQRSVMKIYYVLKKVTLESTKIVDSSEVKVFRSHKNHNLLFSFQGLEKAACENRVLLCENMNVTHKSERRWALPLINKSLPSREWAKLNYYQTLWRPSDERLYNVWRTSIKCLTNVYIMSSNETVLLF